MSQSLAHQFLEFCRSKPADEGYDYWDCANCAFAQFGREIGVNWHTVERTRIFQFGDGSNVASREPRTFGALATRLESALTEQVS